MPQQRRARPAHGTSPGRPLGPRKRAPGISPPPRPGAPMKQTSEKPGRISPPQYKCAAHRARTSQHCNYTPSNDNLRTQTHFFTGDTLEETFFFKKLGCGDGAYL